MNNKIKAVIRAVSANTNIFINDITNSGISVLRMCILSSVRTAIRTKKYCRLKTSQDCCVLGNGPSLKAAFEDDRVRLHGNDVFCVNMFCSSSYFTIIRPQFYFIVDDAFFNPQTEHLKSQVTALIQAMNAVDWKLYLVLSTTCDSTNLLKQIHNPQITILRFNSCTVDGLKFFRHWIYRINMGMPRCQTVVNFALTSAVNMKYKNIYLYGADHSWTKDLTVDDANVVCYGDRHVYNPNIHVIKQKRNIAFILDCFSKMFISHYLIEEYAQSVNCKIYNCTHGSFVDAYERL